jgi:hypothetical protein
LVAFVGFITEGDGEDKKKDLDGNGLHFRGLIVFFTPVFELALDAEVDVDVTGWRLAYVVGPHSGEVLAHGIYMTGVVIKESEL